MDPPCPPTETERTWFYNGLVSSPRLVARSSSTPFRFEMDAWSSPKKLLTVVGEHAIVSKWNDEPSTLRTQIVGILTREKVDWQAFDILRVGYVDDKEKPVVVLISVAAATLSWEAGNQVACHCRNILLEHGLDDVHCEIKESRLVSLVSSSTVLRQDSHEYNRRYVHCMYQLSDQLGTSIASLDEPRREGTKGIYLRRTGGNPETYALTCRHVCYDEFETGCLLPREQTLPSKPVIQLPESTRSKLVTGMEKCRDECIEWLQHNEGKQEPDESSKLSKRIAEYQGEVKDNTTLLQYFYCRETLSSRIFGNVAYTRDYEVREPGFLSDWCLVKLEEGCHERRLLELSNRVYIGGEDLKMRFGCRQSTIYIRDLEDDGTLQIRGIVGISELQEPKKRRIVGMRGRSSGISFGLFNPVKSVVRRVSQNGLELVSQEFPIVGDSESYFNAFTQSGDSGACVFDLQGRAVGMVTSGITREDVKEGDDEHVLGRPVDVTYVTPMAWLLADMEACGLSMEIL